MNPLLQVENVSKYFGEFAAVKNFTFKVFPGMIFGMAGPNGAGKTTLLNLISGHYKPNSGKILFEDKYIHKLDPYQITHLGIAKTFQIPVVFGSLTVLQNVLVGSTFGKTNSLSHILKKNVQKTAKQKAVEALDFVGLSKKESHLAERLSLAERKLLMIATALATEPKLLLLDEPVAGLSVQEIEVVTELIKKINKKGMTIIIVEHIMKTLMGLSQRVMIIHYGEKIAEGSPREVARNEKVIEAYFGKKIEFKA